MAGVLAPALLAALLAACGGDNVHVARFSVTAAGHELCQALLAAAPDRVDGQARRTVTGTTYAVAWGDPAIVLRCGVGKPEGYDRFASCQRADGVDWFVPESTIGDPGADVVMTTIGRSPALAVDLPASYRPEGAAAAMVDLAPLIKAHTVETTPCS